MKRREAREQAFCFLFERTFTEAPLEEIVESAMLARDVEISPFARELFDGVLAHEDSIEEAIEQNLVGWTKGRLSRVSLCVLRMALFEMLFCASIPVSVSINEAVELAKKYGSANDASFVNGLLGNVAHKLEKNDAEEQNG